MTGLPAPLTPAEADLTGYDFMPLFGEQLFKSDFNLEASDAEFRAALRLWWAAWTQVPAASLPNDENKLRQLAGLPREAMAKWKKMREALMRNFVLCSDGRYYHRVLAPHAIAAWEERKAAIRRGKASGVARRLKRGMPAVDAPPPQDQDETLSQTLSTPSRKKFDSESNKGEGEGESSTTAFPVVETSRPEPPAAGGRKNPDASPPSGARIAGLATLLRKARVSDVDSAAALMGRWLDNATDAQLVRAVNDACRSRGGQSFVAAYLDPIIERVVEQDRRIRADAEAKVAKTQAQIAEQAGWTSNAMPAELAKFKPREFNVEDAP